MTTVPRVKGAKSGDVSVAYLVAGDAGHLWNDPLSVPWLRRLPSFGRLIVLDRRGSGLPDRADGPEADRVLATVMLADIVGSTALAAELGDRAWRDRLEAFYGLVREALARFRGRELDTAGDGFLAAFDGPARAVRCASSMVREVRRLNLEVRVGLHAGECEIIGEKLSGIAVHTGARVAALAGTGEVLVSGTVRDLVAGSGIAFEDRGVRSLKGVPGEWRLYSVASA
jgi:class 3 adenylate cyclase